MRLILAALVLCVFVIPAKAEDAGRDRFGPGAHFLAAQPFAKHASRHPSDYVRTGKRQIHRAFNAHIRFARKHERRHHVASSVQGGRPAGCPSAWCGCWLAQHLGLSDRNLWLAREWAHVGSAASGPSPGVIAVWSHHVGIVRQVTGPGTAVILSGNDGHRVRERERSIRGVIAWRTVGARYAGLMR